MGKRKEKVEAEEEKGEKKEKEGKKGWSGIWVKRNSEKVHFYKQHAKYVSGVL